MGDGITHLYLGGGFDSGNDISHIATADFISRAEFHLQNSDFICYIFLSCVEEFDLFSGTDGAVLNLEICNNTSE